MRKTSTQGDSNLTFANLWVNSNYSRFRQDILEGYLVNTSRPIILVGSENTDLGKLPFPVREFHPITQTAFRDNLDLVYHTGYDQVSDYIFLFSAGPLGNVLAYKWFNENKNNTYLDIGSTINIYFPQIGANRGYLRKTSNELKTCIW